MTPKAKDSYGSEAVELGHETREHNPLLNSTLEDNIRRRAYEIFLERGSESGRDLEDWLRAARELTTNESKAAGE